MTTAMTAEQLKAISRVQKLLNMARDGGASEAEANFAIERAEQTMQDHGLTMATIMASGGTGEARDSQQVRGRAHKSWMRELMEALAEASFVLAAVEYHRDQRGKQRASWKLIGRVSGVTTARLMHEYLMKTISRVVREKSHPSDELFMAGMGERLSERVRRRHDEAMYRQRVEAEGAIKEQEARAAAGTASTALVVVLEDYAETERELNEDARAGLPPGTTRAKRLSREAAQAESSRKISELQRQGLSWDVAYDMVELGWTREHAEKYEAGVQARLHFGDADEKTQRQRERDQERADERRKKQREKDEARRNNPAYRRGREAGDEVGLDTQIEQSAPLQRLT